MVVFIIAALTLGFISNFHCIGMCGPIALALPVNSNVPLIKTIKIMSYNMGRVTTYGLLGLLFGIIGKSFVMVGLQHWLSIFSGIFILLFFLVPKIFNNGKAYQLISFLKNKMGYFLKKKGTGSLYLLGVLNGLLPCGLVYLAVAVAITLGNPLYSSLYMMFFGLATIPSMFIISYTANTLTAKKRSIIKKISPALTITVALILILRGLNLGIPYISPKLETATEKANCCHKPN